MALPLTSALALGLSLLVAAGATAAEAERPAGSPGIALEVRGDARGVQGVVEGAAETVDPSLSPECRVPGSKLYTLASLRAVKRALKEHRAIHVLAIGSSSTAGVGASSPFATYPMKLEDELEKLFPDIEINVENRGVSGESTAGAAERMRSTIAEIQPDLVVWQAGTNDALARVEVETFQASLEETARWIKSHGIDVVLVDPQYTASLARDPYYGRMVAAIQDVATRVKVPLVQRYAAMRYLADRGGRRDYLAKDQFHLNDLGYRCMAEHVARAITVSLLQPDPATTNSLAPAPAALSQAP